MPRSFALAVGIAAAVLLTGIVRTTAMSPVAAGEGNGQAKITDFPRLHHDVTPVRDRVSTDRRSGSEQPVALGAPTVGSAPSTEAGETPARRGAENCGSCAARAAQRMRMLETLP